MWTLVYFSTQAGGRRAAKMLHCPSLNNNMCVWERGITRWKMKEMKDRLKERKGGRTGGGTGGWTESRSGLKRKRSDSERESRGHRPTPCTGCQTKSLTNERWGFNEPYRIRIRDGWIHTQAGGRRAKIKRDVETQVITESTKETCRKTYFLPLLVSVIFSGSYGHKLDKFFHWICVCVCYQGVRTIQWVNFYISVLSTSLILLQPKVATGWA